MNGNSISGRWATAASWLPVGPWWTTAAVAGLGCGVGLMLLTVLPGWWAAGVIGAGLAGLLVVGWRAPPDTGGAAGDDIEPALRAAFERGGSLYEPIAECILRPRSGRVSSRVVIETGRWRREESRVKIAGVWRLEWPEAPDASVSGQQKGPWIETGTFEITAQVMVGGEGYRFEMIGEASYRSPMFDELIEFMPIPEGSFMREGQKVSLSAFVMGRTQVTQVQYAMVMGRNPSKFCGPSRPVERVSWSDGVEFCKRLAELAGRRPAYRGRGDKVQPDWEADGPRLPTEAEWEYACRAGSTTVYCFGDDVKRLAEYGWYDKNSGNETHDVADLEPNQWWLYDMHGNVWEWVWDWYGDYPRGSQIDPPGPVTPDKSRGRVVRGGAFWGGAWWLGSANRDWYPIPDLFQSSGFRCAGRPRRQP